MPVFDYHCEVCGREATRLVPRYDEPQKCVCGHLMTKLPCAPVFILKGAGFHSNDYPKRRK